MNNRSASIPSIVNCRCGTRRLDDAARKGSIVQLDVQLEIQTEAARVPVGAADHRPGFVDRHQLGMVERRRQQPDTTTRLDQRPAGGTRRARRGSRDWNSPAAGYRPRCRAWRPVPEAMVRVPAAGNKASPTRIDRRAQEIACSATNSICSMSSSGPELTTRAVTPPAASGLGNHALETSCSPSSEQPVVGKSIGELLDDGPFDAKVGVAYQV